MKAVILTISASPLRIELHAMSSATMALEHPVSTSTLGPCMPKYQLTLFAIIIAARPVADCRGSWSGSRVETARKSSIMYVAKTAVRLPRSFSAGMPAFSKAWYAPSRAQRCCGFIVVASLVVIEKNGASNAAGSSFTK